MKALKGRNIIAQVVRPGYTMYTINPACKDGTLRAYSYEFQSIYRRSLCRPCRPEIRGIIHSPGLTTRAKMLRPFRPC